MFWQKGYRSKKQILKENEDLKLALEKEEKLTFEEYFKNNTSINTANGLAIDFKGKDLVKIFASSFWDLVVDSDNYVVCDLIHEDKSVEVIIKKKGKLSPQEKLKQVQDLLARLLAESETESDVAFEVYDFLNREEELEKSYEKHHDIQ